MGTWSADSQMAMHGRPSVYNWYSSIVQSRQCSHHRLFLDAVFSSVSSLYLRTTFQHELNERIDRCDGLRVMNVLNFACV